MRSLERVGEPLFLALSRFLARIAVVAGFVLGAAPALAQDAISVELEPRALAGHDQPSLVVRANQPVARIELDLRGPEGRLKRRAGPIAAGRVHRFPLPLRRPGRAHFEGVLELRLANGEEGRLPLALDVELLAPIELSVAAEDVDLERRILRISASRPVATVQVSLTSDRGLPLGTTEQPARVDEDGKVVVAWEQSPGTVLRMSVRVTDEAGYFAGIDLFPWRIKIEHEDVNFPTGAWTIPESEVPKLEASLHALKAAVAKYGSLVDGVKLFIAGHTDRVGDAAHNQALSEKRARAIGKWFRGHGLKVQIAYAGCGERLPIVDTPDETPEAKNRRAEYIVAIEAPLLGGAPARWHPL